MGGCQRGVIYKVETSLKCAGVCGRDPGGEGEEEAAAPGRMETFAGGGAARVRLELRGGVVIR